jgi:hypothetical protein
VETGEQRIAALVAALDSPDHNEAEEARFALQEHYGADAFDALLDAAPTFGDFAQVLPAEGFESIGDARALPALLPWLGSEDPTAVEAVGSIGSRNAIPALHDAWAASKSRGEAPSWSEPSILRSVLSTPRGTRDGHSG